MKVLTLSGGSVRGAYQIGCLKHLLGDLCIQYDAICGNSVGAINGAFLAMFPHGQEKECAQKLEELWKSLTTSNIYVDWLALPKPLNYLSYLYAIGKSSLYNSEPLNKLIKKHYDQDKIQRSGKKLRISAISLNTGEFRTFTEEYEDIIGAILASSSFPGAFCPVELENQLWTDSGVMEITPLKSAIALGATDIDIIMTSPKKSLSSNIGNLNMIKLWPRIVDIMSEEILENDIDRFLEINELILAGAEIPGKRHIPIRIFRPDHKLVKSSLDFEQEAIRPMIDKGYKAAKLIVNA